MGKFIRIKRVKKYDKMILTSLHSEGFNYTHLVFQIAKRLKRKYNRAHTDKNV